MYEDSVFRFLQLSIWMQPNTLTPDNPYFSFVLSAHAARKARKPLLRRAIQLNQPSFWLSAFWLFKSSRHCCYEEVDGYIAPINVNSVTQMTIGRALTISLRSFLARMLCDNLLKQHIKMRRKDTSTHPRIWENGYVNWAFCQDMTRIFV